MPIINRTVPNFRLQAYHQETFTTVTDADLADTWSVLFFYPADFTFVCPTGLADLADIYPQLQALGVEVYSISTDTHFEHKAWHDASETIRRITYPMLADPTGTLTRTCGVHIEEEGVAYRGTFVIAPDRTVKIAEIHDQGIGRNAAELLRKVQAAQFVAKHPGEACPARWRPGARSLTLGIALVGKL